MTDPLRNIKLVIEYDGTDYHGWQVQDNARTVQGELRRAIARITGEEPTVTGASRTDAGVHARGQVCSFRTSSRIPTDRLPAAINANLPADIAVVAAAQVGLNFHPRIAAVGKLYTYRVCTRQAPPALNRRFELHHPRRLDLTAMQAAADRLLGEHDFSSFQAAGSSIKDPVRTLWSCRLSSPRADSVILSVSGNGFLYNMVRIMVGTLLLIGSGKLAAEEMATILAARDRRQAGPTAPPHGLCLEEVYYRPEGATP